MGSGVGTGNLGPFMTRFAKLAWATVALNLGVVVWGAVVRATGSGAGCGNNWPECNGEVIPLSGTTETLIEFVHRATSGVALIAVAALAVGAFRLFPPGHRVRAAAVAAVALIVIEALIGAGLVLFDQVADNQDVSRGFWVAAHFVNTLLLVGALGLVAWWGSPAGSGSRRPVVAGAGAPLLAGAAGLMLVGMAGAITALGDTLFPVDSVGEGLAREFSATAHFFERMRLVHPLLAVGVGLYLLWLAPRLAADSLPAARLSRLVVVLVVSQLLLGLVNVALAAPIWLQLLHLLLAELLWIVWVLFTADRLQWEPAGRTAALPEAAP